MIYDAIIIGGGPAGLMAANQFEQHNLNYILLEKNEKCGKKLLLTGGKRCNVTNHLPVKNFIDTLTLKHKRFLYHSLTTFGPKDIIQFFKTKGLGLVLEENFKYFPETEKSSSVLDALMADINKSNIHYQQSVKEIHKENQVYKIVSKESVYFAKNVLVATGSNSFPSTGSSGDGLVLAKHLGIKYTEFTPAETHIYSTQVKERLKDLQGVSLSSRLVKIKALKKAYQGDLIFTHFGLSGPVIMHLSEFIYEDIALNGQSTVEFSFIDIDEDTLYLDLMNNQQVYLHKFLEGYTTKRIVDVLLKLMDIESKKITEIKKKDLVRVCQMLTAFEIVIDQVEMKERAYVNKGGIGVKQINPKSMEIKDKEGLYFIGEITDLHGPIGGYNITIALSTGYLASKHVLLKAEKSF